MMQWQVVTPAEAQQNPLYGFGGWLYAFYGYALVNASLPLSSLLGDGSGLAMMYGPENVGMMRAVNAVSLLLLLPFLVLAPLKHPLMPVVTIACFWISLVILIGAMLIGNVEPRRTLIVFLINAVTAAGYTWYLLRSKRVNVTYRHRVSAEN